MSGRGQKNRGGSGGGQTPPARHRARLPVWKKFLFAFITTAAVLALLEGGLWLAGLRPVLYDRDPYVGFSSHVPLFVPDPADPSMMVTARGKLAFFNPQRFPRTKPPGAYRIFCVGGSTTYGRPYDDRTSFPGWLRALLPAADPSRKWEVINAGGISYASYRVAVLMEELAGHHPDLIVVYSGHNEFLERRTYAGIIDQPRAVRGLGAVLGRTRTYALLSRAVDAARRNGPRGPANQPAEKLPAEVRTILDETIGPTAYHRDDDFRRRVLEHYRYNLARIVDIARSAGAEVVLVAPAANLRDSSPFKSQHPAGTGESDRARFDDLLARARDCQAEGRLDEALALLDQSAAIDGRHADALFRRGRVLWQLGRHPQAKAAFTAALEEDVCPLRALTEMRGIVSDVAAGRGAMLVDFAALIEGKSQHQTPGSDWFLDHVHPTIEGNRVLAEAVMRALAGEGICRPEARWDPAALAAAKTALEAGIDQHAHGIALRNLSKVLAWAGKMEDARALALRATELAPGDAESYLQVGYCALALRDNAQAIVYSTKTLELAPDNPQAHSNLAIALAAKRRFDESIRHFRLAKALCGPAHPEVFRKAIDVNVAKVLAHMAEQGIPPPPP